MRQLTIEAVKAKQQKLNARMTETAACQKAALATATSFLERVRSAKESGLIDQSTFSIVIKRINDICKIFCAQIKEENKYISTLLSETKPESFSRSFEALRPVVHKTNELLTQAESAMDQEIASTDEKIRILEKAHRSLKKMEAYEQGYLVYLASGHPYPLSTELLLAVRELIDHLQQAKTLKARIFEFTGLAITDPTAAETLSELETLLATQKAHHAYLTYEINRLNGQINDFYKKQAETLLRARQEVIASIIRDTTVTSDTTEILPTWELPILCELLSVMSDDLASVSERSHREISNHTGSTGLREAVYSSPYLVGLFQARAAGADATAATIKTGPGARK